MTSSGNVVSSQVAGALNATGSAPLYACRAWVNFNGTGTVAIRASGNVSSITDRGTGQYTLNFATAISDANYSLNVSTGVDVVIFYSNLTTSSFGFELIGLDTNRYDAASCTASVFR